ncbi:Nitrilase [Physocladia obscura]|uniref:Nitrilase n=1 Tax=Physocladia obscura TaxID=109957 RepID=A0AAD5SZN4_9FUNG|nr:Nitrilase [Physocladia obscura]
MTVSTFIGLAVVQDSPIGFELEASIAKLEILTAQAAAQVRAELAARINANTITTDSQNKKLDEKKPEEIKEQDDQLNSTETDAQILVVFPEAFLSAYPRGYDFGATIGSRSDAGRAWFGRYHASSVPVSDVNGPVMSRIRKAAASNNVTLVVGVVERCDLPPSGLPRSAYGSANAGGTGSLYCTALTISPSGTLLSAHRKLMPTASERVVWAQGDGADVRVVDSPVGKVGAAICWENYMPLQRMALYAQNIEFYVAPTADSRETWTSSMRHIAQEGRCFVLGCNQYAERRDYPVDYPGYPNLPPSSAETVTLGGSVIVGPLGNILAGPLFGERGVLTAVVRKEELVEVKMDFDPIGHYARPDIFKLSVDAKSKSAIEFLS